MGHTYRYRESYLLRPPTDEDGFWKVVIVRGNGKPERILSRYPSRREAVEALLRLSKRARNTTRHG